ncbi:MAG: hypothetical protein ACOZQL_41320 [Myxococcota bacterium]
MAATLWGMSSFGFKIETHLYVGQQVINDLEDDGRLTFVFKAGAGQPEKTVTIAVPAQVRDAILANRNEYLLGMVGPDAMPDVVVGQMFPHPGVSGGWMTNDWLRYVMAEGAASPATRAFSYGYLGHAASDTWAHSWVNQYAGTIFSLIDGETLAEERHAALESYVALRQPDLKNRAGTSFKPWQVVQASDTISAFLRDRFIYAPGPQAEYARQASGAHLVAFKRYRDGIESAAQSSVWNKIDLAVAKYFVQEYTGYLMSDAEAQALINEVQRLNDKVNRGINLTQDEVNSLNARLARIDKRFSTAVQNDSARIAAVEQDLLSAQATYEQLLLEKTCEQVDLVCPSIPIPDPLDPLRPCPSLSNPFRMCGGGVIWVQDAACRSAFQATCRLASTVNALRDDALSRLVSQRSRMVGELTGLFNDLSRARTDALQVADALVDLQQITTSGSPVQQLLFNWRNDTDVAFAAYTRAATQMMLNTMDKNGPSPLAPVQQWLDCHGAALQGAPYVVSNCGNRQALQRLMATLDRLASLPTNSVAISIGLPTTQEVSAALAQVKASAIDALRDNVARGLLGVLPQEYQNFVNTLRQGVASGGELNLVFNRAETSPLKRHGLLLIADTAERVDREMGTRADGKLNAAYFAPLVNAVVYSKLALLDAAGIAQLATEAGVAPTSIAVDNLVVEAAASIDGNHQWLTRAPPYPRINGGMQNPPVAGFGTATGFPLFRRVVAPVGMLQPRDGLFLRLFKGPLSPGIDQPREISNWERSFSTLLGEGYPYRTCVVAPYSRSLEPADNQWCPATVLRDWSDPNYVDAPPPTCPRCVEP